MEGPDIPVKPIHRLTSAGFVVALLVSGVILTSCGSALGPRKSKAAVPSASGSAAIDQAKAADWQSEADSLYVEIAGTADQRGAGDRLAFHVEQDPVTTCMQNAGINYTPPGFVDAWANWPSAGSSTSSTAWLAPLGAPDYVLQEVQAQAMAGRADSAEEASADKAFDQLSPDAQAAWKAAIASCPEGDGYEEAWHPQEYYPLLISFHGMVGSVDVGLNDSYGPDYVKCMTDQGFGAQSYADLVSTLDAAAPPIADIPDIGDPGDQAWNDWVGSVRQAIGADTTCRAAAYAAGWAILGPELSPFADKYAQQLADEEAGWNRITGGSGAPRAT